LPPGKTILQTNVSVNPKVGTFRGFHFEKSLNSEWKIMSVIAGKSFISAICVDKSRADYKRFYSFNVSSSDCVSLIIPPWYANSFLTLESQTIISYAMTLRFEDGDYGIISRNEPVFNDVHWPIDVSLISDKDAINTNYF
jgi:dTDP-4-dehydrorhamnose 3,5-epimerase